MTNIFSQGIKVTPCCSSATLSVMKLEEGAILPSKSNPSDAGYDLYAIEETTIPARGRALIRTGIAMAIPEGHAGLIWPRSGTAVKAGLDVLAGVVDSGYRGEELNKAVGGSSRSQHCKGEAVDLECPGTSNYDVAKWIEDNLDYDQLILEFYTPGIPDSGWVHVSYTKGINRKQSLTAMKEKGKTVYKNGLIE